MPQFPPDTKTLQTYFIGMLVAEISLFVVSIPIAFIENVLASSQIEEAGVSPELVVPEAVLTGYLILILFIFLPATIASYVGLFQYKAWGRWLYFVTTVAISAFDLVVSTFDLTLGWGLSSSIDSIGSLVCGAVLTMIYLTPLANRFNKPIEAFYVQS